MELSFVGTYAWLQEAHGSAKAFGYCEVGRSVSLTVFSPVATMGPFTLLRFPLLKSIA